MLSLIAGLLLFLGIHSISIVAEDTRNRMVAKSEMGWKAIYSLISIAGVVLIANGYATLRLEPVVLYVPPYWMRHVTYLLMLPVMVLLVAPYLPGKIKQVTKHPQLIAVKLWALSHLLVNGMLADVILFGAFLAWAVVDRISMKKRQPREVPALKPSVVNDVLAIVIGVGLAVVFILYLHKLFIGMPLIG
ncbi:NnrU family protein [Vibrio tapetis subsp. quintayensis]|uniref:NnrU family protein n=1 Tax=Vibrio tapetis TaxID=52443 RepID=UPI0025B5A8CE|nr:NnrU family protein [Vibrio tapetis]MDN3680862.1 NnrU family protein [Vibrio tapetis subsp. quintayensis]